MKKKHDKKQMTIFGKLKLSERHFPFARDSICIDYVKFGTP